VLIDGIRLGEARVDSEVCHKLSRLGTHLMDKIRNRTLFLKKEPETRGNPTLTSLEQRVDDWNLDKRSSVPSSLIHTPLSRSSSITEILFQEKILSSR
jgi:hypothetical protein